MAKELISLDGSTIEMHRTSIESRRPWILAAHPATVFGSDTAALLTAIAGAPVVCLNASALGASTPAGAASLEAMVDELEAVRRKLSWPPVFFWGMSGGGWLALLYARRHPEALAGIVVESACLCFAERVADPGCVLCPAFPAWRDHLDAAGLLGPASLNGELDWVKVDGVGQVLRQRGAGALVVSPAPLDDAMRRMMPVMLRFDARPWAASIRVPALVIAGENDLVAPLSHARAIHEAIPGSRFLLVPAGGHVPSSAGDPLSQAALREFFGGRAASW